MPKKIRLDRGQIEVVDDFMADVLRGKTAAERIRISFDLWTSTRNMLLVHLRKTHPDWNAERIKQEVARRLSHGAIDLPKKRNITRRETPIHKSHNLLGRSGT